MRKDSVGDLEKIKQYAHAEGCNKSGFTGLFALLSGSMDILGRPTSGASSLGAVLSA
jgi:hypothetical protein